MSYDTHKRCEKGSKEAQVPTKRGEDRHCRPSPGVIMGADRALDAQPRGNRAASLHHGEVAPDGRPA